MENENYSLNKYIGQYLNELLLTKYEKTYQVYSLAVRRFGQFCGTLSPSEITQETVNNQFCRYLENRYRADLVTVAIALQSLRYFFEYLKKIGVNSINPQEIADRNLFQALKGYLGEYHGQIFSEDERRKILNFWANSQEINSLRGLRNQVILEILFNTGLNISELTNLNMDDVDLKNWTVNVRYDRLKSRYKNRSLILKSSSMYWLKKYLSARKDDNKALFVGLKVTSRNEYRSYFTRLTPRSVERVVEKMGKELNLNTKISPSTIRSTYIVKLIRDGVPINELRAKLGHSPSSASYLKFARTKQVTRSLPGSTGYFPISNFSELYGFTSQTILNWCKKGLIQCKKYRNKFYLYKGAHEFFERKLSEKKGI